MAAGMVEQSATTVAAKACSRVILSAHDGDRQQHNEDCNPPENRTIHLSNPPRTNTNLIDPSNTVATPPDSTVQIGGEPKHGEQRPLYPLSSTVFTANFNGYGS
jgi:hypothetical protein